MESANPHTIRILESPNDLGEQLFPKYYTNPNEIRILESPSDSVEQILSKYYTKPIGRIDASTLSNSGTGFFYGKLIDDFTIVRIMQNGCHIGYMIQIYEYLEGIKCRNSFCIIRKSFGMFKFHGSKEFINNSKKAAEFIKNLQQLIATGSVDVTKESWDWDDNNNKIYKTDTHKFELFVV
jgi:hypothetical protein